jgi:hypothetical protein
MGAEMNRALVKYEAMCSAIDAAYRVDEVKDVRDKALALEHYARQAKNVEAERQACEIRLRAERKAGQLTAKIDKLQGRRLLSAEEKSATKLAVLKQNGITPKQAAQWEKLGAIPQAEFNSALKEADRPTTAGIIRATAEPTKPDPVSKEALWLWGRLNDFARDGLLDRAPRAVMATMTDSMKDDVHTIAPRVAAWLRRIGSEAS